MPMFTMAVADKQNLDEMLTILSTLQLFFKKKLITTSIKYF